MSKYCEIVDDEVLPYKFKQRKVDTVFYIGNTVIGTIYKISGKWAAVSYYENRYGNVNGFATRMDAAQYLLQVFRVHKNKL
jgi:hypothetical protein